MIAEPAVHRANHEDDDERAEQQRNSAFQVIRVAWILDPIRNEPQFKAIEARMKFPQ